MLPELSVTSNGLNVGSLFSLWALYDIKGHPLTFLKTLEAAPSDCGKMSEQVFAAVFGTNEPESLCIVEPLNCTERQFACLLNGMLGIKEGMPFARQIFPQVRFEINPSSSTLSVRISNMAVSDLSPATGQP